MGSERVYYACSAEQAGWTTADWEGLWRYLNRLVQFVGPTQAMREHPGSWPALIQARRTGRRDEELASMDLGRMSTETCWLLRWLLVQQGRYELALERFANLRGLEDTPDPGHEIRLSETPLGVYPQLASHGILL